jgi:FAD/FMN-containing dehydrogenase
MALQTQGGQYELLVDLGGSPGAVARSQREATELAVAHGGREAGSEPFWQEALASPVASRHLTVRLTVLPSRLAEALASLEALGPTLVVAFPTVGHIYARWPEEADARAVVGQALAVARAVGGTGVVHSWPWLAAGAPLDDVWGPPPPSAALMRRVKEAWDPAGVLAPGRMVAGI